MVSGAERDGIRIYGSAMAAVRARMGHPTICFDLHDAALGSACVDTTDVVHVHLTDRLFDDDAQGWSTLLDRVRHCGLPLVVTMHDLPQRAEGADRFERRQRRISDLARRSDLVVVSSEHERRLAAAMDVQSHVVAHPVFPRPVGQRCGVPSPNRMVIAGFVHPGKGILEFLTALGPVGGTPLEGWELRLVGTAAAEHRTMLSSIDNACHSIGLSMSCTGSLSAAEWDAELRDATFGIAPHRHCSASGSILAWTAVGRRPFVSRHGFTEELSAERPDAVTVVCDPSEWSGVIGEAVQRNHPMLGPDPSWRRPEASIESFDRALATLLGSTQRSR